MCEFGGLVVVVRVMCCYATHRHVMLQARSDFDIFTRTYLSDEEKVVVHAEISFSV